MTDPFLLLMRILAAIRADRFTRAMLTRPKIVMTVYQFDSITTADRPGYWCEIQSTSPLWPGGWLPNDRKEI